jgi:hypothetical protein
MKDPQEADFIKQIKDVLHDYEEPYLEGSWEQFSESRKVVAFPYWKWMLAAAVVLIVGSVWMFSSDVGIERRSPKLAANRPAAPSPVKIEDPKTESANRPLVSTKAPGFGAKAIERFKVTEEEPAQLPITAALAVEQGVEHDRTAGSTQPNEGARPGTARLKDSTANIMDFLTAQSKANKMSKTNVNKDSKWDFGFEILPTMSNAAVNVGAGLTAEFKLSKRFALGSGISMVGLQAGKSLSPGVSLLSTKLLQSVDANVTGIDIPLNIVFKANKNLYASVGVSYFNVIQENRSNTFVSERQISAASMDPVTGISSNVRTFVSETTQEPATESGLNGKSYIGFFNLSIGRKQQIFNKYNIYFEPFLKLPVGKLSEQDLKLTNGGVKFRVSF